MRVTTILLIEHDLPLQLLYCDVLRGAGWDVYPTTHNDDLVAAAKRCRPAIAIISGGSRGLYHAGWRAAEALRHYDPVLPLVMISTNTAAVNEVGRTARGSLFVVALQKPFRLQELLDAVARHT